MFDLSIPDSYEKIKKYASINIKKINFNTTMSSLGKIIF